MTTEQYKELREHLEAAGDPAQLVLRLRAFAFSIQRGDDDEERGACRAAAIVADAIDRLRNSSSKAKGNP